VFNANRVVSNTWVLPREAGGRYTLHINAEDLTVPYEAVTDHGVFEYHPGDPKVDLGVVRSLAFRLLEDKETRIRVVLRKKV